MKKTNKENPLTTFRKTNEARQTLVKKSIKKAQDGIEMNDDLINKSGYGAKKSTFFEKANLKKYIPWEGGPVELINPARKYANPSMNQTNQITPEMANRMYEGPRSVRNIQGKAMRQSADILKKYVEKQKKGGTIKKKMQNGGSSEQGTFRSYGAESKSKTSGSTYGYSPQAKRGGIMIKKKK